MPINSPPPIHPGLFTMGPDGAIDLLGSRCCGCDQASFPRSSVCTWCGGTGLDDIKLSRTGTLWGWAVVHARPPGYSGDVPFGMGVVELPEGIRVVTRVDVSKPALLAFGAPVRFTTDVVPTASIADTDSATTFVAVPVSNNSSDNSSS